MSDKKTFWPYGIALFLLFMVCMIILTVYIALGASPEDDNAYFSTRQEVDKNINDILSEQKSLEDSYSFFIFKDDEKLELARTATRNSEPIYFSANMPSQIKLEVLPKNAEFKGNATARATITRFATSKDDINLGELKNAQSSLQSEPFALKEGYWKALINVNLDGKNAYFEQLIIAQ